MLTWIQVDSHAIHHNLKQFRMVAGSSVLLMPVVKANAYGHGLLEVATICDQSREADCIAVVNVDEAITLIKKGIKKPIVVLSFIDPDEDKIRVAVRHGVAFPVYSRWQALMLNKTGEKQRTRVKVHLKIDTGTSRLGVLPHEAVSFAQHLIKLPHLELEGVWSHFASSETDPYFTKKQHATFGFVCEQLQQAGIDPPLRHIACSAASALHLFSHENAIRIGLSLYGLHPSEHTRQKIKLKPALAWYTTVIQVKTLPKGTSVGYGRTFTTKRTTRLAVLPVGYWDGYDRRMSNHGFVLLRGVKCPIIGRICMNICMVDATKTRVQEGDRAVLIGKSGRQHITVDDLARWCDTINYEIVDRINPVLPRIIV